MSDVSRLSPEPAEAPALDDEAKAEADPRFARIPRTRQAWTLIVSDHAKQADGRITVTETAYGGRVSIVEIGSGIEHEIVLNVTELRTLAAHAQRIARRVANRPEWKP